MSTRSATSNQDNGLGSSDRNTRHVRTPKDGQKHERDDEYAKENKTTYSSNRRSLKDDAEMWSSARQHKNSVSNDRERFPRKSGDHENGHERDNGGEKRNVDFENDRQQRILDSNGGHVELKEDTRRSRDVHSWNRNSYKPWEEGTRIEKSKARDLGARERKGHTEQDRGWSRGGQQDEDPLWMDGIDSKEDKKQAPTQADFEEFRARMRAQNAKVQDPPSSASPSRHASTHERVASGGIELSKSKLETPLDLGDLSDKFYDILSRPKHSGAAANGQAEESQQTLANAAAAAKMAKSSKFSSLFSSESAPKPPGLEIPAEVTSSEDKAGFQRILKLLDQQQQQQSNPNEEGISQPETKQNPQASPTTNLSPFVTQDKVQSPLANSLPKTRDGEFLLNLMRQPQQQSPQDIPRPNNGARRDQENTPNMPPFSHFAMSPPAETPQQTPPSGRPPGFFDETPRQEMPLRDKLNPTTSNQRGAPPALYDVFNNPQRPSQGSLPPGLERRPPGFDQLPPGFGQHPPQRQGVPPPPPPGFQPPQRGNGGAISGMFGSRPKGPGPGLPPPPGFMNMGGPPPGFPGMGFGHEASPYGGGGGFEYGQGFPPPGQQRR